MARRVSAIPTRPAPDQHRARLPAPNRRSCGHGSEAAAAARPPTITVVTAATALAAAAAALAVLSRLCLRAQCLQSKGCRSPAHPRALPDCTQRRETERHCCAQPAPGERCALPACLPAAGADAASGGPAGAACWPGADGCRVAPSALAQRAATQAAAQTGAHAGSSAFSTCAAAGAVCICPAELPASPLGAPATAATAAALPQRRRAHASATAPRPPRPTPRRRAGSTDSAEHGLLAAERRRGLGLCTGGRARPLGGYLWGYLWRDKAQRQCVGQRHGPGSAAGSGFLTTAAGGAASGVVCVVWELWRRRGGGGGGVSSACLGSPRRNGTARRGHTDLAATRRHHYSLGNAWRTRPAAPAAGGSVATGRERAYPRRIQQRNGSGALRAPQHGRAARSTRATPHSGGPSDRQARGAARGARSAAAVGGGPQGC